MWPTKCAPRRLLLLGIALLSAATLGGNASAQSIDLSLNVYFTNPLDDQSGGTWQVLAKSEASAGIAALNLYLSGIANSPATPVGPRGIVNGNDPAGFSEYAQAPGPNYTLIVAGQRPVQSLSMGEEQSIFYGVGTIANGEPGDVGPMFSSLTNPQAIPWATGDPFGEAEWDTAAVLAAGTFSANQSPSFFSNGMMLVSSGGVYTSAGTSTSVGPILSLPSVSTTIRDNLGGSPDYNGNGIVDAADYTVWRDTLGQEGIGLIADGTRNGVVDQPDYEFWALNFGLVIPPGASSSNLGAQSGFPQELGLGAGTSVPEPATGTLLIGALGILFLRRRFRHLRSVS